MSTKRKWDFEIFGNNGAPFAGGALSLGNFDGFHAGHEHLIADLARNAGSLSKTVLTFSPHPASVVGRMPVPLLCSLQERIARLLKAGVDAVIVQRFDADFASLDADAFCTEYLGGTFSFSKIVLGFDFRFGRGRGGDAAYLAECGKRLGWDVARSSPLLLDGSPVSSSRVREALVRGDVSLAKRLLGRPFSLDGLVVKGDQRGRHLGFPTLNLQTGSERLLPRAGVYAGRVRFEEGGEVFPAVMSLGLRPTFGDHLEFRIEAHVFDFSRDVYGHRVEFLFEERLRDEKKFGSVESLQAQMQADAREARSLLSKLAHP